MSDEEPDQISGTSPGRASATCLLEAGLDRRYVRYWIRKEFALSADEADTTMAMVGAASSNGHP